MGKFLNTTYTETIDTVNTLYNTLINNNLYKFSDKKPVTVDYYNLNKDFSSLDPGSKLTMDYKDEESSLRWNVIHNMVLYSFPHFELNTDNGEFGLEADKFEGETFILPNTIIPYEGDYFEIKHVNSGSWLFIVKDVQQDTLENGFNAYRISFKLDAIDRRQIIDKVLYHFRYFENKQGTNLASVIRCEDFDIAEKLDRKSVMLKGYFQDLFYNKLVQTFIYQDITDLRIYDPMMIEFMIRNRILEGSEDFVYVTHQLITDRTISLDYDKTFFRAFELKSKDKLALSKRQCDIIEISSYGTNFSAQYETYFKTFYHKHPGYHVNCLSDELVQDIMDNNLVEEQPVVEERSRLWQNIIVKYFNDGTLTDKEIDSIDEFKFQLSTEAFYTIPILIFCIERAIEKVLK